MIKAATEVQINLYTALFRAYNLNIIELCQNHTFTLCPVCCLGLLTMQILSRLAYVAIPGTLKFNHPVVCSLLTLICPLCVFQALASLIYTSIKRMKLFI